MLRRALTFVSVGSFALLAAGCGLAARSAANAPTAQHAKAATAEKSDARLAKTDQAPDAESEAAGSGLSRKVGDFMVYEYVGAFSKQPLTLTEQVVALEGDVFVVDFVFGEGSGRTALRVRMKSDNQVVKVSRITAGGETDAAVADYDALMQKTQFVPDSNDAALGTEHTSCLVGDEQVECDATTYRVTYGRKQAKLTITTSAKVPGRDLGGEVVTDEGKVLYRARLVERGNEAPVVNTFAKLDHP
jgi:hypothetical protein